MIIVTKPDVTAEQLDHTHERVESLGLRTHVSRGERRTIIGCIGDDALLEDIPLLSLPGVASVGLAMPFNDATLNAWLTPAPPGVTEVTFAIELPPLIRMSVSKVTGMS